MNNDIDKQQECLACSNPVAEDGSPGGQMLCENCNSILKQKKGVLIHCIDCNSITIITGNRLDTLIDCLGWQKEDIPAAVQIISEYHYGCKAIKKKEGK